MVEYFVLKVIPKDLVSTFFDKDFSIYFIILILYVKILMHRNLVLKHLKGGAFSLYKKYT